MIVKSVCYLSYSLMDELSSDICGTLGTSRQMLSLLSFASYVRCVSRMLCASRGLELTTYRDLVIPSDISP